MTEMLEEMPHLITDVEKVFAFLARISTEMSAIRAKLLVDDFTIDMYGADPGGIAGVIGGTRNLGGLTRQYNGPFVIESILATWGNTALTVTLQIGADRTIPIQNAAAGTAGVFNPQDLKMQVARDDVITLTTTPAAPCFLNIFGYADIRNRDNV